MKANDFFREVRRGNLYPLYYFWGPEKWLIDEAVKRIEEKALVPATRDFNREILEAGETSAESILASLQAFPVRSPRRLVIIRQADQSWKGNPQPFLDYFQNPNPQTCAVFIGERADLRTKFFEALEKKGIVVPFYPPFEKELSRWIHTQSEALGFSLTEDAVTLLVERVGANLREIQVELQKLALGKASGKRVEEKEVRALTEDTRSESPFEFPLAVGRLTAREPLRLLHKILQQGESPVLLFSLLVRQLRLVRRARNLRTEGLGKKEIEGKLRIHPRNADSFWRQAEALSSPLLESLWKGTLKADQRLKGSRADKKLLLEEYLLDLLTPWREGPQRKPPAAEGGSGREITPGREGNLPSWSNERFSGKRFSGE
jgi:DNA polymerase-3 subunit delta